MTTETIRILTGNWYDEDGYLTEQGAKFPLFVEGDRIKDDLHLVWTVDSEGNLVSEQSCAYFSPNSGELARVGLV
ncbi:MAG TPA: hypothetical protein PKD48_01830 [Sphingopyxis sp.]|nr:hypothetical protein [Sphingopyxis sp.]